MTARHASARSPCSPRGGLARRRAQRPPPEPAPRRGRRRGPTGASRPAQAAAGRGSRPVPVDTLSEITAQRTADGVLHAVYVQDVGTADSLRAQHPLDQRLRPRPQQRPRHLGRASSHNPEAPHHRHRRPAPGLQRAAGHRHRELLLPRLRLRHGQRRERRRVGPAAARADEVRRRLLRLRPRRHHAVQRHPGHRRHPQLLHLLPRRRHRRRPTRARSAAARRGRRLHQPGVLPLRHPAGQLRRRGLDGVVRQRRERGDQRGLRPAGPPERRPGPEGAGLERRRRLAQQRPGRSRWSPGRAAASSWPTSSATRPPRPSACGRSARARP